MNITLLKMGLKNLPSRLVVRRTPKEEMSREFNITDMIIKVDSVRNYGESIGRSNANRRGGVVDFVMVGKRRLGILRDPSCPCLMERSYECGKFWQNLAMNAMEPRFSQNESQMITVTAMPKPAKAGNLKRTVVGPENGGLVMPRR
jgi:hypothetical protein